MATHSSVLAWRKPGTREPGGLPSMGSHRSDLASANSVGGNEGNGDLLQKVPCTHCYTQCPQPCSRPALTHASTGDSWTLLGKSGSVSCGVNCSFLLGPGAHMVLFVPSKCLFPQSCISSSGSMVVLMVTSSKRAYVIPRSTAPRAPTPAAGHC